MHIQNNLCYDRALLDAIYQLCLTTTCSLLLSYLLTSVDDILNQFLLKYHSYHNSCIYNQATQGEICNYTLTLFQSELQIKNIIDQDIFHNSKMRIIILIILLVLTHHQQELIFGNRTKITILNQQTKSLILTLPENIATTQDLFITAETITNVPTQIPTIKLFSPDGFSVDCYENVNQFEQVCSIKNSNLSPQRKVFTINMTCVQTCTFWIDAYLNDVVTIQLNKKYTLHPQNDNQAIYQFELEIPPQVFSQIKLEAIVQSKLDNIDRGYEMYANVGNSKGPIPDQTNFQYTSIPIQKGKGIDISKQDLPFGTWIKIAIYTNSQLTISFSAELSKDKVHKLTLSKTKSCFLGKGTSKVYWLDLNSYQNDIQNYDINIISRIFSGIPQIRISFTQNFYFTLQNYGVSGNLDYTITPELRNKYKFAGSIFINVSANTQSYLQFQSSLNRKQYIYVQQAITYISQFQPGTIENYIFDYYYTLPVNQSSSKYLYFTMKIQMLKGSAYCASRICNQTSNSACLITKSEQLSDRQFIRQTNELPGQILIYYNLYQIYLYAQVKQCNIISVNTDNSKYHCKIHMVGVNVDYYYEMQWGLTTFSRQDNIALAESSPFKDMVYQESYNYYSFIIPSDAIEITIFLTLLSGETILVSSQRFKSPQKLFVFIEGNDIKSSSNNVITYSQNQLQSPIYIGVYGVSMSEFVVNVRVKRNSTQIKTPIKLLERLSQLNHIEQNQSQILFLLTLSATQSWVLEIIELIGSVHVKLFKGKQVSQNILCNSSKCIFVGLKNQQLLLIVQKSSSQLSKFMVSYYPLNQCRLFSVGITNFLQVEPNSTECINFFLQQADTLISYSQNLIHSLNTQIQIEVLINNKTWVNILEFHNLILKKDQIIEECKFAQYNSSKSHKCLLTIKIKGDKISKVQLQLIVVTLDSPIPLIDGISLSYFAQNVVPQKPIYFYYQDFAYNTATLIIRSLTYNSYHVAYSWIDYKQFFNQSNINLYPQNPKKVDYKTSFKLSSDKNLVNIQVSSNGENCTQCILLIAIYPKKTYSQSLLQIEVMGLQGMLGLGETIKRKIKKDEVFLYELGSKSKEKDAVVTIKNEKSSQKCLTVSVYQRSSLSKLIPLNNEFIINNGEQYKIQIAGFESCEFEISYWSMGSVIRSIQTGNSYSLSIQNQSSAYFVYYHKDNQSFFIFESIVSGYVKSFCTPVVDSLEQTIVNDSYIFGSDSIYEDIEVLPGRNGYCFGCYYLIKMIGAPQVSALVGVSQSITPILLKKDSVIREKLSQNSKRRYQYYSNTEFTIKINIIFGQIQLKLLNLNNEQIISQLVKGDRQWVIDPNKLSPQDTPDYVISITAIYAATYSFQITNNKVTRLIEGYPLTYHFQQNSSISLSFSHSNADTINMLIILEDYTEIKLPSIMLSVLINIQQNSQIYNKTYVVNNYSQTGNLYLLSIEGHIGDYLFSIVFNQNAKAKVLITRNRLTYLQPYSLSLANNDTVFEIYNSAQKSIMIEIFSCQSEVEVFASSLYSQIESPSINSKQTMILQHSNYGGHYVIQSQSKNDQFYVLVKSRSSSPPLYKITYSYVSMDRLPYSYFETMDLNIKYQLNGDSFALTFQLPTLKSQSTFINHIKGGYQVIISDFGANINALVQCKLGNPILSMQKQVSSFKQAQTYSISQENLRQIVQNTKNTFYIGIVLTVTFDLGHQPYKLTYIYDPLEVSTFNKINYQEPSSALYFMIIWIVIPIILGLVFMGLSLKFCLKRWQLLRIPHSQLIEEQESNVPAMKQNKSQSSQNNSIKQ